MTASPSPAPTRAGIVAIARAWIGTPYRHQASLIGAGTDCIGLVRGIWRTLYGAEPEPIPGYTRDWAETEGEETLLAAAGRHMAPVPRDRAQPGDVLVFRYRVHAVAKHTGILATSGTFVHAAEGAPVAEVALSGWWRRRIVGVYSFPGLED